MQVGGVIAVVDEDSVLECERVGGEGEKKKYKRDGDETETGYHYLTRNKKGSFFLEGGRSSLGSEIQGLGFYSGGRKIGGSVNNVGCESSIM